MDFNLNTFMDTYSTEIIGGLLTASILLSFNFIKDFIKNFKNKKLYAGYIGEYYIYNFTPAGKNISSKIISIKSKFGKLIVYANNEDIYKYKGEMTINERNLYIRYDGVYHFEKVQINFYSPLHREMKSLVGVLTAVSILAEPFACICILTDKELSENEAKKELKRNGYNLDNSIIKVSQNKSIFYDNISSS